MNSNSSAIAVIAEPFPAAPGVGGASPHWRTGAAWGALGVLAFSFTLPLTRVAVHDLPATFVAAGRAVGAGVCALVLLVVLRESLPPRHLVGRLTVVALGVVLGFPWLSSLALTSVPAAHAAVVIGLLPAATAVASALRTGQRPGRRFWAAAAAGALAVTCFAALANGGLDHVGTFGPADLLLVGAVVAAAIGYAEGAVISRQLGSWQTICWALVLALPAMAALAFWSAAPVTDRLGQVPLNAWLCFAYLSVVSMWLGFFAWYRGLALGPVAQVSQVQLVQPVLGIAWAALILGEQLTWPVVAGGIAVVACAAVAVRSR